MPIFVERYILPFLVLIAGVILFTNPMHWTVLARCVAGASDLVLALVAALWVYSQTQKQASKSEAELAKATKRVIKAGVIMIPAGITLEDMTAPFNDKRYNTNQASRLTQDYIGKWMGYTGPVGNVNGDAIFFRHPRKGLSELLIAAGFENSWFDQISMLPPGKKITIVGKIIRIDGSTIFLRECELFDDGA